MTDIEKLTNEITNDKELMEKLGNAKDSHEVSMLLAEKGVNLSAEQIDEFMSQQDGSGELSPDELENVAGGFKLRYINPFYWVGRLIAWGVTKDMC